MKRSRRTSAHRAQIFVVGVALLATTVGYVPFATATTAPPLPTLAQLEADVAYSVKITTTPNPSTTVPPLTSMQSTDASITPQRLNCFLVDNSTLVPSNASTECAYGDLAATRMILLTGDSEAGMWLPALDAIGKSLNWKIVFLAMRSCGPWRNPNATNYVLYKNVTSGDCTLFAVHVASWAKLNHPKVAIMVGRGYPVGRDLDMVPNLSSLESEMNTEVAAYKGSGAKLLVISPAPRFTTHSSPFMPSDCLSFVVPVQSCQYAPTKIIPQVEVAAENHEVAMKNFQVINVSPLFCTSLKCTIIVKDYKSIHLVFYNGAHINRFFSVWVSTALQSLVKPLLPA